MNKKNMNKNKNNNRGGGGKRSVSEANCEAAMGIKC